MKRRLALLIATLAALAMIPLAAPAVAHAGCLAKVDTGQKPVYDGTGVWNGGTPGMNMDEWYYGANCTGTHNDNPYHVNAYIQQYYGGAWHEAEDYPNHYTTDQINFWDDNTYYRACLYSGVDFFCNSAGDTMDVFPCYSSFRSTSTLVRMRIVVVNEFTGSTATAASGSTALPSTCH